MVTNISVHTRLTENLDPLSIYSQISQEMSRIGNTVGQHRFNEKWQGKLYPSEEKLRIWTPPKLEDNSRLYVGVTPFGWDDLQRMRQMQPVGNYQDDDPLKYALNAVALTINGVIESDDGYLVFHRKKGGAKEGSIHTFGGYVERGDINKDGDISDGILRELSEKNEIGLKRDEMAVQGYFGTEQGKPSILWDFGTGAIYARVKAHLPLKEIQERMMQIGAEESLDKKLYTVLRTDAAKLEREQTIHPQTKAVLPVLVALYSS